MPRKKATPLYNPRGDASRIVPMYEVRRETSSAQFGIISVRVGPFRIRHPCGGLKNGRPHFGTAVTVLRARYGLCFRRFTNGNMTIANSRRVYPNRKNAMTNAGSR